MPTPMRFIQLPGDSPPLYVSKSSFSQSDSSWFDWNDEEATLFPNWETGITRKLNKSHWSWDEEIIPLSNQVSPVSPFGNSTVSSSFQSNQDESLCKRLDLDKKVVDNHQEVE